MRWLAVATILVSACAFDPAGGPGLVDDVEEDDKRDDTGPEKQPSDDSDPGPLPEPDPLPEPETDPGPCEQIEVELLLDNHFDSGGADWVEQSPYELITDRAPVEPHTPDYVAWLGGYAFGTDRVLQPLMIPNQTITMTLRAVLASDEPLINFSDDARLRVELWDMDENTLEVIEDRKSGDIDSSWEAYEWDIEGYYNGQPIVLMFEVDTDFDAMSVLVDSVELVATVCE